MVFFGRLTLLGPHSEVAFTQAPGKYASCINCINLHKWPRAEFAFLALFCIFYASSFRELALCLVLHRVEGAGEIFLTAAENATWKNGHNFVKMWQFGENFLKNVIITNHHVQKMQLGCKLGATT